MLVRPQAFAGFSPMISTMKRRLSAIQLFPFCMHAFGVLDESRYGFRLSSGRRHIGHTDRTIHRIALRHFELRLHGASLTERGRQVRQPLHHLSKMPVCKAAMLAPCNPIQIEEEARSEEHTSELQSLMRISYAVFCLKKKTKKKNQDKHNKKTLI